MFNPEKEVPSLELCKELKELGYPQEGGGWYWDETVDYSWKLCFYGNTPVHIESQSVIKAPTCRELGEWLPASISVKGNIYELNIELNAISYDTYDDRSIGYYGDDNEANLRAKEIIWLAKNGYVKFKKE